MPVRRISSLAVLAGAAIVILKVVTSAPQLAGQAAGVAITWLVVLAFVVIGLALMATDVPPINGWACLLVAFSIVPGDLNDSHYTDSALSALGFVLEPLYLVAAVALILRYPRARLTPLERLLVWGLLAVGLVSRVVAAVTTGPQPDNFWRPTRWTTVADSALAHDVLAVHAGRGLTVLLLLLVAAVITGRLLLAHGLSRQAQAPFLLVGLVCALATAADQLVWALGPDVIDVPGALVRNLTAALLPFALLADLLRRRAAGADVSRRILTAALTGNVDELQEAVRGVFVDPSATIEVPDGRSGWLDTTGRQVPTSGSADITPHRLLVVISGDADDDVLLRLNLDAAAVEDDGLVASAAAAIRVGTQNTRLHADLLASMAELRRSQARIVESGLAERRRVERNLHDGAQQQLLGVAATLAQADLVQDDQIRDVVTQARSGLKEALAELRTLARGIHPAALSQGGLAAALPSLCERAPWPVRLRVDPAVGDLDDNTATAVYFVVAELLTNAAKHAQASSASITVRISSDDPPSHRSVCVIVSDDGVGGAHVVPGGGLSGLRDRVEALSGTLTLERQTHRTRVVVSLPAVPGSS